MQKIIHTDVSADELRGLLKGYVVDGDWEWEKVILRDTLRFPFPWWADHGQFKRRIRFISVRRFLVESTLRMDRLGGEISATPTGCRIKLEAQQTDLMKFVKCLPLLPVLLVPFLAYAIYLGDSVPWYVYLGLIGWCIAAGGIYRFWRGQVKRRGVDIYVRVQYS